MTFQSTEKLANLAANDFLRNPTLMMAVRAADIHTLPHPILWHRPCPIYKRRTTSPRAGASQTYLEWAAAANALASSGVMSLAVSTSVFELVEVLMLAPAAYLDYFDAQYTKIDEDGEYAGFSMSGHLLRNESINDLTGK
eukprot:2391498-Prymnesium_polylepis.1